MNTFEYVNRTNLSAFIKQLTRQYNEAILDFYFVINNNNSYLKQNYPHDQIERVSTTLCDLASMFGYEIFKKEEHRIIFHAKT